MTETIMGFVQSVLPPEAIPVFSERALWFAAESQKATAIPALTLVASLSLLVVVLWIGLIAWFARFTLRMAHNARNR